MVQTEAGLDLTLGSQIVQYLQRLTRRRYMLTFQFLGLWLSSRLFKWLPEKYFSSFPMYFYRKHMTPGAKTVPFERPFQKFTKQCYMSFFGVFEKNMF